MATRSCTVYIGLGYHLTLSDDANAQVIKVELPTKVVEKVKQMLGERGTSVNAASTLEVTDCEE